MRGEVAEKPGTPRVLAVPLVVITRITRKSSEWGLVRTAAGRPHSLGIGDLENGTAG